MTTVILGPNILESKINEIGEEMEEYKKQMEQAKIAGNEELIQTLQKLSKERELAP